MKITLWDIVGITLTCIVLVEYVFWQEARRKAKEKVNQGHPVVTCNTPVPASWVSEKDKTFKPS